MTVTEVLQILEKNKNDKYIEKNSNDSQIKYKSFGLGIGQIKNIAKEIGKNHKLATELWDEPYIETKILSSLISDPKLIDNDKIEEMMLSADYWIISHSLVSNLISKFKDKEKLFEKWYNSENERLLRGAYLLLYEIAKKDKNPGTEYYKTLIDTIENELQSSENYLKDAMNNALIMIGSLNKELNGYALKAAKNIGEVIVDYGDNSCQALSAEKHLSSKRIQDKIS